MLERKKKMVSRKRNVYELARSGGMFCKIATAPNPHKIPKRLMCIFLIKK